MKKFTVIFLLSTMANYAMGEKLAKLNEALPQNININSIMPIYDWDNDGCYPAAGISRQGKQNSGLKTSGAVNGHCHDPGFLDISNTLHRYACINDTLNNKYCSHVYDSYYEKDQILNIFGAGHRHDWETVIIWTKNEKVTHGSVSCHGLMETKQRSDLPMEAEHMKVVYHKDGIGTHCYRFAKANELAENSYQKFVTPSIISWHTLYGDGIDNQQMRAKLNSFDYGSASIKVKDNTFLSLINGNLPTGYPQFTQQSVATSM